LQYQEFIPSPSLRRFIKCYWLLHDETGVPSEFERIIPDGSPELIIHLGLPFEERINGVVKQQETSFLYGQLFSSIEICPSIRPRVAGIKFHPYGLPGFTSIPQTELVGKRNSIKEVFPFLPLEEWLDKLNSEGNTETLFSAIDQMMLFLMIKQRNFPEDKIEKLKLAVSILQTSNGLLKIDELTRSLNMSRRELERKFNRYVGLSPKQLARIFRLQFALQSESKSDLLTHLALEAGYYDQAHFIRDFSSMVDQTPSQYFQMKSDLTEKFLLKEA